MKIIDQTPFYNEKGEIGLMDRAKAIMQYGNAWMSEVEAQKAVMPVLGGILDKNYTLLRNLNPPGLETSIPFILVGPTGVLVIYVTPVAGMYRAKGDQWGTISGNTYRLEKPNLLTRTERMARAVQLYLQRQGFSEMLMVEAVLLCSNPAVHVDSLRPVVRVVMRDALERFAVSIAQARAVMSPEAVQEVADRLVSGPRPVQKPVAEESLAAAATPAFSSDSELPSFIGELAGSTTDESPPPTFGFQDPDSIPDQGQDTASRLPVEAGLLETDTRPTGLSLQNPPSSPAVGTPARRQKAFSRRQWTLLIVLFGFWGLLMAVLAFLIISDLFL